MRNFEETEMARAAIRDITRAYEAHKEVEMTPEEKAVKEQRTLLYKWWCGKIYGHLYKRGICLRCGRSEQ
jgi:hypothetical protein